MVRKHADSRQPFVTGRKVVTAGLGLLLFTAALCTLSMVLVVRALAMGEHLTNVKTPAPTSWPKIAVIVPCRGDARGVLAKRLLAVTQADYPSVEFIFVTDAASDPSHAVFEQVSQQHPITSVIAPPAHCCSQKNSNLLAGIAAAGADVECFVFLDSDGVVPVALIRSLVAALLAHPQAPAATGFRWYTAASRLRMAWNAGGFGFILDPRTRFVWGGAMAFRRAAVCGPIRDIWARTLSDDLGLSAWLRQQSALSVFVPEAVVQSEEPDSLWSFLRWTTRQTYITRVYDPRFFTSGFVSQALGWAACIAGLSTGGFGYAAGALWLSHLSVAYGLSLSAFSRLLACSGWSFRKRDQLTVVGLAPVTSLVLLLNSLAALFMRTYDWAGIRYRVRGADRIEVVGEI